MHVKEDQPEKMFDEITEQRGENVKYFTSYMKQELDKI